ncbi:hypothetical protein MTO96_008981 [Rhipicephalus appendiculatus]
MQNGSYTSLNKTADGDGRRKSSTSAGSDDTRGKVRQSRRVAALLHRLRRRHRRRLAVPHPGLPERRRRLLRSLCDRS